MQNELIQSKNDYICPQNNMNMANIELRLKEICKDKGLTLKILAEDKLGVNYVSFVQAIKRNSFSILKLQRIAEALEVEVPELFVTYTTLLEQAGKPLPEQTIKETAFICPNCGRKLRVSIK